MYVKVLLSSIVTFMNHKHRQRTQYWHVDTDNSLIKWIWLNRITCVSVVDWHNTVLTTYTLKCWCYIDIDNEEIHMHYWSVLIGFTCSSAVSFISHRHRQLTQYWRVVIDNSLINESEWIEWHVSVSCWCVSVIDRHLNSKCWCYIALDCRRDP